MRSTTGRSLRTCSHDIHGRGSLRIDSFPIHHVEFGEGKVQSLSFEVIKSSRGLSIGLVAVLGWCAVVGCNNQPAATYPAGGTVKLADGTPLDGGQILFRPSEGEFSARASIGPDGTFQLKTFEAGDGAVAGSHQVMVTPGVTEENIENAVERAQKQLFHPKYQSLQSSPLEFTVDPAGENQFEIVLDPP